MLMTTIAIASLVGAFLACVFIYGACVQPREVTMQQRQYPNIIVLDRSQFKRL